MMFSYIRSFTAGFFRDYKGSYDNMFRMHGGLHLFVGLMFMVVVAYENTRDIMATPEMTKENMTGLGTCLLKK